MCEQPAGSLCRNYQQQMAYQVSAYPPKRLQAEITILSRFNTNMHIAIGHGAPTPECLRAQHDAISAVKHQVGNVGGLSTSGAGGVCNISQHMCQVTVS